MSCLIAQLQGGDPQQEIFPIPEDAMTELATTGLARILGVMGLQNLSDVPLGAQHHVGAARRPDGRPFYLTTIASKFASMVNPVGTWRGGFFAPFGVGDVVGIVEGDLAAPGGKPTTIKVRARLFLDGGGDRLGTSSSSAHVSVDWEIRGNQATRPNKAAVIASVTIIAPGPHSPDDIRRCVALHAPQRSFGEPRAIVAMQCGVAAACLLEAIC